MATQTSLDCSIVVCPQCLIADNNEASDSAQRQGIEIGVNIQCRDPVDAAVDNLFEATAWPLSH